ncbi:hypothetical protein [Mariniphaga sp.]|uniref:hypothetical protein n=1 Tax=Mariniphaga sp. TaxID=1954475 RepID=UPI0035680D6E
MNQDTLLYTLPQWFVFAGIIASIYGWVEHKKTFRLLGPVIFFLLGIFSLYSILNGSFSSSEFLTPAEIISEEMEEETMEDIPFVAQLLPAYFAFLFSGLLAVPTFILEWKEKKGKNLMVILTALAGVMGFFIIVGALRSL